VAQLFSLGHISVMAKHTWNGHEIDIACYSEPKFLWMLHGFAVRVDGRPVGRSPDHFEGLRTTATFQIDDGGVIRRGRVVSRHPFTAAWAPYCIFVEEAQIARGVTYSSNWYATYGILAGLLVVLLFLLHLIYVHKHVA
jgi:hypothetical protein